LQSGSAIVELTLLHPHPQGNALILAKVPSRTDYVDEVYRTLLDAISDGTLAPGARVTQEDLAERMNVSRSPVLQALRMLKKDGLLEDAPGRGLLVTRLEPVRMGQLYRVRGALDALAARLAAERRAQIPAALIKAGREAAAGSDVRALIEADSAFHRAIYEASGNPYIVESAMLHWIHLRRVMGAVLQHGEGRADIWDEHQAICTAIHAGDGERAAALSQAHADHAGQLLVHSLEQTLQLAPHAA
jgi:DNA-binding GntR family transcriptional regulator